jgi:hypothetical protein
MAGCATVPAGDERTPVAVVYGLNEYLTGLRDELADEDRLTAPELRAAREQMNLAGDPMARLLQGVNPRTLRSWESGREAVPAWVRPNLAQLRADTAAAVAEMVASLEDVDEDDLVLLVYRDDKEFEAAAKAKQHQYGRWTASWHRQVAAQAAAQTGARLQYADESDEA